MATAPAARGQGAAPAPQARGPQAEPARGAEGARPWDRDWDAVPDPLGREVLPPVSGGVWVAELGLLEDHQGNEEPALRCRAPPEGWAELGGAPGGLGAPGGPREGPPDRDLGGLARQGANVASFPAGGGGAPHHGHGGQQLAPPRPAHRPNPLELPPAEPTAATAPAPTQAAAQVTARPGGDDPRRWA